MHFYQGLLLYFKLCLLYNTRIWQNKYVPTIINITNWHPFCERRLRYFIRVDISITDDEYVIRFPISQLFVIRYSKNYHKRYTMDKYVLGLELKVSVHFVRERKKMELNITGCNVWLQIMSTPTNDFFGKQNRKLQMLDLKYRPSTVHSRTIAAILKTNITCYILRLFLKY